jgi:hypothetical protein
MKKLCFLLLITLLISTSAFSQEKVTLALWHLTIVDSATNQGIVRANVSIDSGKYLSTNQHGQISLRKDLLYKTDTLHISSVGYTTGVFIPGFRVKLPDTIRLARTTIALKEVAIKFNQPKGVILGDFKKKYNTHRVTSPDEKYLQYIPNDTKAKGVITSIEYVINDELRGIEMPFRIGIYTKSKTNPFPDHALITDTIIVYNHDRKTHLSIDISKYNLQLPDDGVLVALETLPQRYYRNDSLLHYGQKRARTPGIDMDLKKKGDYSAHPRDKEDRKTTYSMVMDADGKWSNEQILFSSYMYDNGNNFAITITVAPD